MNNKKKRNMIIISFVSILALFTVVAFYYINSHEDISGVQEVVKKFQNERNLKPVKKTPPKDYILYTRYRYIPPSDLEVSINNNFTEIDITQIKVISTGELSNKEIRSTEGKLLGQATLLKVYLDDGGDANLNNSFDIVVEFIPEGNEGAVTTDIIRGFIYQEKVNNVIEELNTDEGENWDEIDLRIREVSVSDDEIQSVRYQDLFAEGKKYTITPYAVGEMADHIDYLKSNSSLNKYYPQELKTYFEVVNSYYGGGDSGIIDAAITNDMSILNTPVFLFI